MFGYDASTMTTVNQPIFGDVYRGKRVWLTGDTGFKGSWLAFWLRRLGAEVRGVGLEPESADGPFVRAKLAQLFRHETADIRDAERMAALARDFAPQVVFHLAAQALVRRSYADPVETFDVNVRGAANVLPDASAISITGPTTLNVAGVADAIGSLAGTGTLNNSGGATTLVIGGNNTSTTFSGVVQNTGSPLALAKVGSGTLTLPNAQLTGGNKLEVRNGGTVQLLGDNTYTGSTTILTKYTSTSEAMAAVDSNEDDLSVGSSYYKEVAPILVVDKLSNGGAASSIGSATNDAANRFIQGSTLKYVGAGVRSSCR